MLCPDSKTDSLIRAKTTKPRNSKRCINNPFRAQALTKRVFSHIILKWFRGGGKLLEKQPVLGL